ncbi:hypothetical protein FB451DRAFT_1288199 [Mycena latifolia]|nr:hypothetical protein FB451DRAFT_1288199 [Mycena latifolia]
MDPDPSNRVDGLWFPDGTLVIRAECKIFRVAKSVLAARSSVFRDMVAFPQGEDAEIIDGSSVVLHDSATDVEVFLRAIFDSSYFMPAPEPIGIGAVLGILRLSHKYDVQYLYRRALGHLEPSFYFSSVTAFRSAAPEHLLYPPENGMSIHLHHFLSVTKAATEVGAAWLLPVAYYRASHYEYDDLVAAIPLGTDRDVQKCIKAGLTLSREHATLMTFLMADSPEGCTNLSGCNIFRLRALEIYFEGSYGLDLDPLRKWRTAAWDVLSRAGMCGPCIQSCKDTHANNLQYLWARLPSMFDLPDWEELAALKTAAMGEE